MVVAGELVFAQAELRVPVADRCGHGRVGGQEVKELERVLLVCFPDLLPPRFVGRVPVVAAADQADRELSADRIVAVELAAGQRVEVEADTFLARLQRAADDLEPGRVVVVPASGIGTRLSGSAVRHSRKL